jgi:hypothetical protein
VNKHIIIKILAIVASLFVNIPVYAEVNNKHAETPSDYVDYVVMGKSINHRQSLNSELKLLNTVFFAEIFPVEIDLMNISVSNGVLTGPGDASKGLNFSSARIPFLAGQREMTIKALTRRFPDSTYFFSFDTLAGSIKNLPATFVRNENELSNPNPIEIALFQQENKVDINAINPDQDLKVTWSNFDKGSTDSNNIIDDMIYVILGNCHGEEIEHSGHAISNKKALTFDKNEFIIPKSRLSSGQVYQLEVEHSNMETDTNQNIEIIVTYAATTFLDFKTKGENLELLKCPADPYAMDGGQTDRIRRSN